MLTPTPFQDNTAYAVNLRYAEIITKSLTNGPGERTVLFMQGCTLACPNCQNFNLWPHQGGALAPYYEVAGLLLSHGNTNLTISGGEPFQQIVALARLLERIKLSAFYAHVVIYTGYTWAELFEIGARNEYLTSALEMVLQYADVIVDGRYVSALAEPNTQQRGSLNQRPINITQTLLSAPDFIQEHISRNNPPEPVVLDWDTLELFILEDGATVMAEGVAAQLYPDVEPSAFPRCGEMSKSNGQRD